MTEVKKMITRDKAPKAIDQNTINDLAAKAMKSFEEKIKKGPAHVHTSLKMAQACLDCQGISQIYCTPVIDKPCTTRITILEMVRIRMLY